MLILYILFNIDIYLNTNYTIHFQYMFDYCISSNYGIQSAIFTINDPFQTLNIIVGKP